ncbi:hypothetical protein [Acidaminococcus massiliensis]|uniref:hypothetical protein n=1 Tax=Acidaminococcus massiliensis TaxID=1852375 RepID=UPI0026DCE3C8|nr:hypothetical protein [Acidaminococcus massiliensis]
MRNRREDFMVWGASLGIHAVLLLLLSLTGIFSMAAYEPKDLTEVALYDVSGGDEGGGGGSQGEASPEPAAPEVETSVDEVAIPEENVPAVEKRKNSKALFPRQHLGRSEKKVMGLAAGPAVVPAMEMAAEREMDPAAGPAPAMEAVAAVQPIRML